MKQMEYEPLKNRLENYVSLFPLLRKVLYVVLDRLLLRQRYVKREIKSLFPRDKQFSVYDAGAGFCQYSDFVLATWPDTHAFATDLKTSYLASYACYTDSVYPGRFSYKGADLSSYHPLKKYDLALAIDILEHIEDDLAALKNFHAALKPGAYLLISTPSDRDEAARFTAEHVRPGYNKQELEDKLRLAGFNIHKSIYTYGLFGSLAWKLLMKKPLQMMANKKRWLIPFYYLLVYPWAELMMQIDLRLINRNGTGLLVVAQSSHTGVIPDDHAV